MSNTNFFDNDTVIMPFPISSMPLLTKANPRFTFGVQATSFGYGTIDTVGTTPFGESVAGGMSFNARTPGLSFSSGGEVAQLVVSAAGTTIDVRRSQTELAADRAVGRSQGHPGHPLAQLDGRWAGLDGCDTWGDLGQQ